MEAKDWITLIGVLVGLVWWRVQLIGKRRTELAEEALTAFGLAADALAYVRSPFMYGGEIFDALKEAGVEPPQRAADRSPPGQTYLVTLWRLRQEREQFASLRKTEFLLRYHFGDAAADAVAEVGRVRGEVAAAARVALTVAHQGGEEAEDRGFLRDARLKVMSMGNPDVLGDRIEAARKTLEAELKPHLRADAAMLPLYALPGRIGALGKAMIWGKPGT